MEKSVPDCKKYVFFHVLWMIAIYCLTEGWHFSTGDYNCSDP